MRRDGTLTMRKEAVQRRSRETVDVILQAAAQVFSARGYAGCTTNHIAERAGVSVGSLYQYFPNKDAILMQLVEGHLRDAQRGLDALRAEVTSNAVDLDVLIEQAVRAMISLHGSDPGLHRILLEQAPPEGPLMARLDELRESAVGVVRAVIAGGTEEAGISDLRARIVVHTVEALAHRFAVYDYGRTDPEVVVGEITRLVKGYLSTGVG